MSSVDDTGEHEDAEWWRQAVVYQIYPRSFADSDGDGLGDVRGIISRVPYLRDLGVDAVWLSPFYPSALHGAGIKIFVDIVANHSSNRHEWFRAALTSPAGSPERDRYLFRDGHGEHGELPPNDWPSHFGPSEWTRTINADGTSGQWCLHLFASKQPDFNWENPEVEADFIRTLRFWSDRGVDGFRIDVAHALKKDMGEPYEPVPSIGMMSEYPIDGSHPLLRSRCGLRRLPLVASRLQRLRSSPRGSGRSDGAGRTTSQQRNTRDARASVQL